MFPCTCFPQSSPFHHLTPKVQPRGINKSYWSTLAHTLSSIVLVAYAIHMAGISLNTHWLMFEVSSKRLKEGGKCNVVYALSSSKQLGMFSQNAQYISMIVFIPCLWITHHIPCFVITCMRTDGWKSGNSSLTIQLEKSSWVKHIPNLSVSFCSWKRAMHCSGETSEIRYEISCTKTLHVREPS